MRRARVITMAMAWAVLTVLAALAVWWGLQPLLAPGVALPPSASPSPAPSSPGPSPVIPSPSPARSSRPITTATTPTPVPSSYDGWSYDGTAFTRTFVTPGGTATVRIANGQVSLVSHAAASGYTAVVEQVAPSRLVVRFVKAGAQSIVDAYWWEGRPYVELT